jgi:hypothetical protein
MTEARQPATRADQNLQLESDAAYEWLLSDHPDAQAERDRRREATYRDERERTGTVLAWVAKINATADAPEAMRNLAATMGPLATASAARAEADYAVPDAVKVAEARKNWETYMQVSAPNGSWDYRYPDRYVGEAAASQPRPGIEPEAEAEP